MRPGDRHRGTSGERLRAPRRLGKSSRPRTSSPSHRPFRTTGELEHQALVAYDALAVRFYDPSLHPTTHFFSNAIENYLRSHPLPSRTGSRSYLEVGSGRGRIAPYLPPDSLLVALDLSYRMLMHNRPGHFGERKTVSRVVASAFALPIRSKSIDGVFTFLGDPFDRREFFREARRVLVSGGFLMHIVPNAEWGRTIRKLLGVNPGITPMLTSRQRTVLAPSILRSPSQLKRLLLASGFATVNVRPLLAGDALLQEGYPPHIQRVADTQGIAASKLPILTVALARAN